MNTEINEQVQRINTETEYLGLRVSSIMSLVSRLGFDIPSEQQVREFLHNAIQAIAHVGHGQASVTRVTRHGVSKLAFVDTGCGMSPTQLRDLVGQLTASANRVGESRFGLGAKITGLVHNSLGIEYTTLTADSRDAVRATLGCDPRTGEYGWLTGARSQAFSVVARSALPPEIRLAGHGTMVVLLGTSRDQDTFALGAGLPDGDRRFETYVNSRYAVLPEAIGVWAASGLVDNVAHRRVFGLQCVLEEAAASEDQGVVDLPAGVVRWFYTVPEESRGLAARDNAPVRRSVSVCLNDPEVEGLKEIYTLHAGRAAQPVLASFGLGEISGRVALVVEPRGVRASHGRTMLMHTRTKTPYSLAKIAAQFKENLPARLVTLIEERLANRTPGNDDRVNEYLNNHPYLLHVSRVARGTGAAAARAVGETGTRAAAPKGRAARARAAKTGADRPSDVVSLATSLPWSAEDFANEPHLVNYLVRYDEVSNVLYYNPKSVLTERELCEYTDGRRLSELEYTTAHHVVLDHQIDRARIAVVLNTAIFESSPFPVSETDRAISFSEYAMTSAAIAGPFGPGDVRRAVTKALGTGE